MKRMLARRVTNTALSLVLLLTVILSFSLPVRADASGTCGEGLTWTLSGGALSIRGTGAMTDFTDENMPPWYAQAEEITSVSVGEGVTRVGSLAFYACTSLVRASLPATLTNIGDRAFKNCASLRYCNLPEGLTHIGEAAFESCAALNGIRLPSTTGQIGDFAFYRCASLSTITVPASVWRLGAVAFAYCTGLVEAKVLCPITRLPDWTFYGCTALSVITLPQTVSEVGELSFYQCDNLSTVSYTGTAAPAIQEGLREGIERSEKVSMVEEVVENTGIFSEESFSEDGYSAAAATTTVRETEHAVITTTEESKYTFSLNGEPSTIADAVEALEAGSEYHENKYGMVTTGVGISTERDVSIAAALESDKGWDDLAKAVETAAGSIGEGGSVRAEVQIPASSVSGEDLKKTAGKPVALEITTDQGKVWSVDQSATKKRDFTQPTYDLNFTVTKLTEADKKQPDIQCETTYALGFEGEIDFKATVGVPLKVGEARKTATLYQKDGKDYDAVQSVVVDDSGTAWFPLANVDSKTEYYVAVNAAGVDKSEAIIPPTLAKEYNLESTLMGMDGKQYRITGRTSRWGITGTQFAIYAAIGIGLMVLIVTLIMVTRNRIMRSKAKYAAGAESDNVDEEALRMEIMRELLGEKDDRAP